MQVEHLDDTVAKEAVRQVITQDEQEPAIEPGIALPAAISDGKDGPNQQGQQDHHQVPNPVVKRISATRHFTYNRLSNAQQVTPYPAYQRGVQVTVFFRDHVH